MSLTFTLNERLLFQNAKPIFSPASKQIAAIATATSLAVASGNAKAQENFNYYGNEQNENNVSADSHEAGEHVNEEAEHGSHAHSHKLVSSEIAILSGYHFHLNGQEPPMPMLSTHLGLGIGNKHQFLMGMGGGLFFHSENEGESLELHGAETNAYIGFAIALGKRVHLPFTAGIGIAIDETGKSTWQIPLHTGIGIHLSEVVGLELDAGIGLPIPSKRDFRRGYDLSKGDAHVGIGVSFSF